MMRRYHLTIQESPIVDLVDELNQNPLFNGRTTEVCQRQANPCYSHTSYLRMRHMEEAY